MAIKQVRIGKVEPRFSNARKVDLGDFVMRKLAERDPSLTAGQIRKVCSHLYSRLRTKRGVGQFLGQKNISAIGRMASGDY